MTHCAFQARREIVGSVTGCGLQEVRKLAEIDFERRHEDGRSRVAANVFWRLRELRQVVARRLRAPPRPGRSALPAAA